MIVILIFEHRKRASIERTPSDTVFYQYSGTNAEMLHLLDKDVPNYVSVTADAFFRGGYEEEFTRDKGIFEE